MIVDRLGRKFSNLRVSLTAACNYACTYCVPDGKRLMKAQNELAAPALLKAVELLQQATGIDKVRITGGEPLVTPKFDEILELPRHLALPRLQGLLDNALGDKKLTFQGEVTVLKFIGG